MTLEGYVDLVYRDDDGLVVVDYKTDAVGDAADLARRMAHYRIQGAAYALAVGDATGEPVVACVFVFLDPAGHAWSRDRRGRPRHGRRSGPATRRRRAAGPVTTGPGGVRRTLKDHTAVPSL